MKRKRSRFGPEALPRARPTLRRSSKNASKGPAGVPRSRPAHSILTSPPGENLPSNGKSELMSSLIVYSWPKDIFPDFAKDPATLEVKRHDK